MEQQPEPGKRLYGNGPYVYGVVERARRRAALGILGPRLMPPLSFFLSLTPYVPVSFLEKNLCRGRCDRWLLHDMNDLSIIYETLQQLPSNSQERQNAISGYRDYYQIDFTDTG